MLLFPLPSHLLFFTPTVCSEAFKKATPPLSVISLINSGWALNFFIWSLYIRFISYLKASSALRLGAFSLEAFALYSASISIIFLAPQLGFVNSLPSLSDDLVLIFIPLTLVDGWVDVNLALNACSLDISVPDSFLNVQPLGAKTIVGNPNLIPAFAPASSNPVCPPLLIETILFLRLGDSTTPFNNL